MGTECGQGGTGSQAAQYICLLVSCDTYSSEREAQQLHMYPSCGTVPMIISQASSAWYSSTQMQGKEIVWDMMS